MWYPVKTIGRRESIMPPSSHPPLDPNAWAVQIAQNLLGIEALTPRGRDALDFHDVGVASLQEALTVALRLGYAAAQAGLPIIASPPPPFANGLPERHDRLFRQLGVDPAGSIPSDPSDPTQSRSRRKGPGGLR